MGCQSGRKVIPYDSKSDLPLETLHPIVLLKRPNLKFVAKITLLDAIHAYFGMMVEFYTQTKLDEIVCKILVSLSSEWSVSRIQNVLSAKKGHIFDKRYE